MRVRYYSLKLRLFRAYYSRIILICLLFSKLFRYNWRRSKFMEEAHRPLPLYASAIIFELATMKGQDDNHASRLIRVVQVFIGSAVMVTIFYGGYYHCSCIPYPTSDELAPRMAYACRCNLLPAATLVWAILAVMLGRMRKRALNPLAGKEHILQLEKAVLANTLEQFVVYLVTSLALTSLLHGPETRLIALYAVAFTVGRVLFNVGYRINWKTRGVGMTTNLWSSLFIIGYIGYVMSTRGLWYGIETATVASTTGTDPGAKTEL